MEPVWVAVLAVVAVLAAVLVGYNRLVRLRNRVDNAWADLDVQLQRRRDLIPNLVATVQGYAAHEHEVLEAVTAARAGAQQARDRRGQATAETDVDRSLQRLFAVAEAYPDLKADARFRALQDELVATENKIAFSRQLVNDTTTAFNTAIQRFPANLVASGLSFEPRPLFETADHAVPGVSLG